MAAGLPAIARGGSVRIRRLQGHDDQVVLVFADADAQCSVGYWLSSKSDEVSMVGAIGV